MIRGLIAIDVTCNENIIELPFAIFQEPPELEDDSFVIAFQ